MSRQAFHQKLNRSLKQEQEEQQIALIICQIREEHPTMCCRYMYFMIKPDCIGRDAFEDLCRRYGFMSRRKINYCRTTYSIAGCRFDNLVQDLILTDIDQVWSSDLTYYRIKDRFYYITFIIDNFSRRILGYVVSGGMQTEQTTLPALRQAISNRNNQIKAGIIFHSDGGGQYYDKDFLKLTRDHKMLNSMCEMAWEHGKAERINGVIKNNYLVHWKAENEQMLRENVDRAVNLYNYMKPHSSLGRKTPIGFEKELVIQQQTRQSLSGPFDAAQTNLPGQSKGRQKIDSTLG